MILKHSIKSIIRTPKKTILFAILLIVLTIFLSIGAAMYDSARNMLSDADKTFTSVVELDYLGDPGSDEAEVSFYKNMNSELAGFDFLKFQNHRSVKAADMEQTAWAFLESKSIKRKNSPLMDYAVLKVGHLVQYEENIYMGIVRQVLFGRKVSAYTHVMIYDIDEQGNSLNHSYNSEHDYLIIGKISVGTNPTPIVSAGIPGQIEDIPQVVDLTDQQDFFHSEAGEKVLKLQESMTVIDGSLQVTAVSSLEASGAYYFNEILLKEGRIFNSSEYREGENAVILISQAVADFYQVKAGDRLPLKLFYNKDGIGSEDFLRDNQFKHEDSYLVAGIFENKENNKYVIYMPKADWLTQEAHSTILARYIVKNGTGESFIKDNTNSLLPNMKLTLYDQGYREAVKPIIALKNNAALIIILSFVSGIAILILFAYLFVIKQKDTLKTMLSLGTGKRRTMSYILYGAEILIFAASSVGALISSAFLGKVVVLLFDKMKATYGTDLRFSERSIGLQVNFIPRVTVNPWLPALIIALLLIVSISILLVFTCSAVREDRIVTIPVKQKKGKTAISIPAKQKKEKAAVSIPVMQSKERETQPVKIRQTKLSFGRVRPISFKFALTSLTRSPGRSLIIPLISMILSVFIIYLGLLTGIQQEKLSTVYDRIPVSAYLTTYKNERREVSGLDLQYDIYKLIDPEYSYRVDLETLDFSDGEFTSLKAEEEREKILEASKYYKEMYLYTAVHYEYMGLVRTKDGIESKEIPRLPNIRFHNDAFGFDWFLVKVKQMPKLAYADDIRYTPDFFNDAEPETQFLEGYDFDALRLRENIGIIPQSLAASYGIQNGDTIRLTAWRDVNSMAVCSILDLKVVGIYQAKWQTGTIYTPWIMSYDHTYYVDMNYPMDDSSAEYELWNELIPRSVNAATFTLKNTDQLPALQELLFQQGYSQVGNISINRNAVVIQDRSLIDTVQSLKNHIRLISAIKPVMLILFGILGYIVSYLLIKHRMAELAILRSMGAKKRQVFFSFFLEQLVLFITGLIPAAVYALSQPDKAALYGTSLLYFIICYLAGTAFALIMMNRAKVLDILFTKE